MTRIRPTTTVLIVSLIIAPFATPAFASDDGPSSAVMTRAPLTLNGRPLTTLGPLDVERAFAHDAPAILTLAPDATGQWGFRRGGRRRDHAAAAAADPSAIRILCSVVPTFSFMLCPFQTRYSP